ncbi:mitochondrial import receptor subunit TOM22, putative [Plasmodium chabaudi chabaudi]|uniref:Mitochondrial import receptor subunit TOM22, putative n=1 Tax=Plasmodium chabaudi chabaudi TaxID=31271 RepID=A0A077TS36_PLACU|nr:mitochondrial import receptor subunit TOM22, putative [Plasmodium chabaudi chabaudi]SCN62446.1 mitochondrial import receptor subunit TOM22, putative [Plasmodium chabaudi chabaudi]VTZ69870.1 mitochondrial import receptor subunit TOM22, putative [Plasmodium chabaudi chabaudi]|eukprot:XP_742158.2 mitochondrial import receptor subunit TOM22, putative [Plasmodium chabaudi chabaudi]
MYKNRPNRIEYHYTYLQHIPIRDSYNLYLYVLFFKMGAVISRMLTSDEGSSLALSGKPTFNFKKGGGFRLKNKLRVATQRIQNFVKTGLKTTSWVVWVAGVSVVVLITPIAFQYEKECQLFEMQAQFFQAQQAANVPQLN